MAIEILSFTPHESNTSPPPPPPPPEKKSRWSLLTSNSKKASSSSSNSNSTPTKSMPKRRTLILLLSSITALIILIGGLAGGLSNRNNRATQASNAMSSVVEENTMPSVEQCLVDWGLQYDWWEGDGYDDDDGMEGMEGIVEGNEWENDGWDDASTAGNVIANVERKAGPWLLRRKLQHMQQQERHYNYVDSSSSSSSSSSSNDWNDDGYYNNNNNWETTNTITNTNTNTNTNGRHHRQSTHINSNDHPYLVSLGSHRRSHHCSGTLISTSIVLTAAHCFTNEDDGSFHPLEWIDFHRHHLTEDESVVRVYLSDREGENVVRHGEFDYETLEYDFALIFLPASLEKNGGTRDSIAPIVLNEDHHVPYNSHYYEEHYLEVVGWGLTSVDPYVTPDVPHATTSEYVTNGDCTKGEPYLWREGTIKESMLCANVNAKEEEDGSGYSGAAACNLDSGGPIIKNTQSGPVQVGISSFVAKLSPHHCAPTNFPNVFARVSSGLDWIKVKACERTGELCPSYNNNNYYPPPATAATSEPPMSDSWSAPATTQVYESHSDWHAPPATTDDPSQDEWSAPATDQGTIQQSHSEWYAPINSREEEEDDWSAPSTIQQSHSDWHGPASESDEEDEWTAPTNPSKDDWNAPTMTVLASAKSAKASSVVKSINSGKAAATKNSAKSNKSNGKSNKGSKSDYELCKQVMIKSKGGKSSKSSESSSNGSGKASKGSESSDESSLGSEWVSSSGGKSSKSTENPSPNEEGDDGTGSGDGKGWHGSDTDKDEWSGSDNDHVSDEWVGGGISDEWVGGDSDIDAWSGSDNHVSNELSGSGKSGKSSR